MLEIVSKLLGYNRGMALNVKPLEAKDHPVPTYPPRSLMTGPGASETRLDSKKKSSGLIQPRFRALKKKVENALKKINIF